LKDSKRAEESVFLEDPMERGEDILTMLMVYVREEKFPSSSWSEEIEGGGRVLLSPNSTSLSRATSPSTNMSSIFNL